VSVTDDFKRLADLGIVERTPMIMGSSCRMFLGFLGAEVIKVEPPESDKTRALTGIGRGFHPTFNRGKKSIVPDLKAKDGRAGPQRLLETADGFVEQFRAQSRAEMSFAPEGLRDCDAGLIGSSLKGLQKGRYENRTTMDEVVQMMTGMAYVTGPTGRPLRIGASAKGLMGGLSSLCSRRCCNAGSTARAMS
jgi:crotonobetainyl-CoA:carnitine CoA-transferase CaiB-like acyl-CoA transferase